MGLDTSSTNSTTDTTPNSEGGSASADKNVEIRTYLGGLSCSPELLEALFTAAPECIDPALFACTKFPPRFLTALVQVFTDKSNPASLAIPTSSLSSKQLWKLDNLIDQFPEQWQQPVLARIAKASTYKNAHTDIGNAVTTAAKVATTLEQYASLFGKKIEPSSPLKVAGHYLQEGLHAIHNNLRDRIVAELTSMVTTDPGFSISNDRKRGCRAAYRVKIERTVDFATTPLLFEKTVECDQVLKIGEEAPNSHASVWLKKAKASLFKKVKNEENTLDSFLDKIKTLRARYAKNEAMDTARLDRVILNAITLKPGHFISPLPKLEPLEREAQKILQNAIETVAMAKILRDRGLDSYRDFFPTARSLGKRKLILLVGPTNSGKTYHALNLLAEQESGAYLAPLRLLALEGQEQLAVRNRPASFVTGEERDIVSGATFVASTIEMLNTSTIVDAILIDEVQNLADSDRGWAWTQAIVGSPAPLILMTGSHDAIPLVQALANYTEEELEIRYLERLVPLKTLPQAVPMEEVGEPGTAIIAFSRRDVLGIKQHLEKKGISASVIYGSLSPDVRREEARRFREGETNVVIATDAIGMGLNLPIQRVIFYTLTKWNGQEELQLSTSQLMQIGGRAGRYGFADAGFVGGMTTRDANTIGITMHLPLPLLPSQLMVRPSVAHLEAIETFTPNSTMESKLDLFRRKMSFNHNNLIASVPYDMLALARVVDQMQQRLIKAGKPTLSIPDQYTFVCAPVSINSTAVMSEHLRCLTALAMGTPIGPPQTSLPQQSGSHQSLQHLEEAVKAITLFCWMAYRYPYIYTDLEQAETIRMDLNHRIEKALRTKGLKRLCDSCGNKIDPLSRFKTCESCHRKSRSNHYNYW